jgi:hypothetical protein
MPAGRPLEPAGNGRPRWMTAHREAARHPWTESAGRSRRRENPPPRNVRVRLRMSSQGKRAEDGGDDLANHAPQTNRCQRQAHRPRSCCLSKKRVCQPGIASGPGAGIARRLHRPTRLRGRTGNPTAAEPVGGSACGPAGAGVQPRRRRRQDPIGKNSDSLGREVMRSGLWPGY